MRTIVVEQLLKSSAEAVFDVLANHVGYTRFKPVKSAELLRPGTEEENGVGAVRRIRVAGAWFEEEITGFERPKRIDYRIVRSMPPIEHAGGSLVIEQRPEGTHLTWTSTFRVAIPLLSPLLTRFAAAQMSRDFGDALGTIDDLAG